ncbi:hypothetical protein C9J20_08485 [Photobacterium phosphoreum]|nr:hypothetical protein CTM79_00505 [Photobacterium phosphoreum]PSW13779.1 hypothetical protein C9J20_08485 [Photobacterium phosphoreum]
MKDCSAQFELFIELLHKLQNRVGGRAQKRGEVVREIRGEEKQQKQEKGGKENKGRGVRKSE